MVGSGFWGYCSDKYGRKRVGQLQSIVACLVVFFVRFAPHRANEIIEIINEPSISTFPSPSSHFQSIILSPNLVCSRGSLIQRIDYKTQTGRPEFSLEVESVLKPVPKFLL